MRTIAGRQGSGRVGATATLRKGRSGWSLEFVKKSTMFNAISTAVCLACILAAQASAAVLGEAKRPYQDRADDKPCRRVVLIDKSPFSYEIEFRGTVDGTMTRMPISYGAYVQGWQPNRSLLVENVGRTDVQNPWVVVNRKRNWRTLQDVVAEATRGYSNPADRARAIWESRRRTRFHACTWDAECNDLVKVLNVYGYTLCGNEAKVINDLWKAAGLVTRHGYPVGHCVSEVFYDGDYHLLDSDEHVICLERDNKTIASCAEIVRDHDLVKRTHTYGIGNADSRRTDEFSASLYWYEGKRQGDYAMGTRHTMDYVLRPGETWAKNTRPERLPRRASRPGTGTGPWPAGEQPLTTNSAMPSSATGRI